MISLHPLESKLPRGKPLKRQKGIYIEISTQAQEHLISICAESFSTNELIFGLYTNLPLKGVINNEVAFSFTYAVRVLHSGGYGKCLQEK